MGFQAVERLTVPTYSAMKFDGSFGDYAELATAANNAIASGQLARIDSRGYQVGETQEYQVTLVTPQGEELPVYGGSFVVSWSTGEIEVYGDADYRAKFTLPEGEV